VVNPPDQPTRPDLVAGCDYPRSYREFVEMFPDDPACTSQSRGLVFRRLLEQAVVTEPVTEAAVTHGYEW